MNANVKRTIAGAAAALLAASGVACGPGEPREVAEARRQIEEAWQGGPQLKVLVLTLAADHPGLPEADPLIDEALASPSFEMRREAVATLARWGTPGATDRIRPLLEDGNELVRRAAARALARLGDGSGRELLEKARRTAEGVLDTETCAALAAIGSRVCAEEAERDINSEDGVKVAAAAAALEAAGDDRARLVLRGALKAQHGERRAPVIEALGAIGGAEDVAAILPYARYRENVIAVIRALGRLGGDQAVAKLRTYLTAEDPVGRVEAAGALLRAGVLDDAVRKAIDAAVASDREEVRYRAAEALARAPEGTDVTAWLVRLAGDASAQVRRVAVTALADRGGDGALEGFRAAWQASREAQEGAAYTAALEALRGAARLDGEPARALLAEGLESPNWAHTIQAAFGLLEQQHRAAAAP
ncbi:MAG: HEAT repeat domain-containing protein [Acidobacteria bacterium]|nr:MAG: HEAT repeat domain-containing protein [Acidobacteriota bacterium]